MKLSKTYEKRLKKIVKSKKTAERLISIFNDADLIVEDGKLYYDGDKFDQPDWWCTLLRYVGAQKRPEDYKPKLTKKYDITEDSIMPRRTELIKIYHKTFKYRFPKAVKVGVAGKPKTALERHLKEMAGLSEKAEFKIAAVAEAQGVIFTEEDKVYLRKDKPFLFEEKYYREHELGTPDPLLLQAKGESEKQKKYAASQTLINYVKRSKPKSTKSKMEKEIEMVYKSRSKK